MFSDGPAWGHCPLCADLWRWWLAQQPDDPVLRLAVLTALALGLATLLVMLQVLALAELAAYRERRRQRFDAAWRPCLALRSLSEERGALPPLKRQQRLWFLLLWNRTQRQLRGEPRNRLNALLRELQLERPVLRLLRSRSVRKRLIALACLRHLGDPAHWRAVLPLLQARNPVLSLSAAQTLVAMHPSRAMQVLIPLALRRTDWALPRVSALCQQAGAAAVTGPLLATLLETPEASRPRLVALLVHAEPRHTAPWARQRLEQDSPAEEREIALACLAELADPRDHSRLLRALAASDANVRLAALQALRRQARHSDAAALQTCLCDSNWWVRQAAADALVQLPGMSAGTLAGTLDQLADRYGRDALRRALAERRA